MAPLRLYDYLTRARGHVFNWIRPLSEADYRREFPIGFGSLARTLTHVLMSEWLYVARIEGRRVPPYADWPLHDEDPPPFPVVESTWTNQAAHTRQVVATEQDWSRVIEYHSIPDLGPPRTTQTTPADLFTQLAFHEVHHRAQVLNILRHLGVQTTDIDFNALM